MKGKATRDKAVAIAVLLTCWGMTCFSGTWHVNNEIGNDQFDGKSPRPAEDGNGGPFASIQKAFGAVGVSDRIEVANTGKPYAGGNTLVKAGGTPEMPLVIDGQGAVISGLARVPAETWKEVGPGVVAAPFWPMSNGLKPDRQVRWWIGVPRIWWLDGNPAPNCMSEEALGKTAGGFFWNKKTREVWVNLPAGKKIDEVVIELPTHGTAICVNTSHVVVKNFYGILSWNDGFNTHGAAKNVLFKNCIALDNCGQGFSAHGWTSVTYEDCLAERCASAGICNVDYCQAIYRRCVLINNTFDGGVGLYNHTQNFFEDCLIAGNTPFEQVRLGNRAHANFANCVILGRAGEPNEILKMEYGAIPSDATAHFWQCTLADAPFVCDFPEKGNGTLTIENSMLTRCPQPFLTIPESARLRVTQRYNLYFDGSGIRLGTTVYGRENFGEFLSAVTQSPLEQWRKTHDLYWEDPALEGRMKVEIPKDSPLLKKGRRYAQEVRIGAALPHEVWALYERTRGQFGTPEGVKTTAANLMAELQNRAEKQ